MEGKGQEREEYKDTQKKPLQKEAARQERCTEGAFCASPKDSFRQ